MSADLQLDSLLRALRTAGLRVGISEVLRLQQVFAGQPCLAGTELSRERLKSLLRAVLVKSVEDRGTFDRICNAWIDRAEGDLLLRRVGPRPVPVPLTLPPPRSASPRRLLRWAATAIALPLLYLALRSVNKALEQFMEQLIDLFLQFVPSDVLLSRWLFLLWPEIALGIFAWLGAAGLWLALRRRRLFPTPAPLATADGPPRAFPLPVMPEKPMLLAPRDQERLAWGIGQFVSEEPTRRLDLAATVRATALAGGLSEMRFYRARFYREVWLWVDEDAADPALPRLAAEIEAVLAAHGLPVERAAFRGVPHRLVTASGQVFAPNEIDERRDIALVVILTDGRRLVRRWASDDQRVRIEDLLRALSHWPHLAFVDASQDQAGLAAILGRHCLAVIAPENTAAFLGGTVAFRSVPQAVQGSERGGESAWASVCALCPAPVDEATALELRRRLGLTVSPFSLQRLRAEAPGPPDRLVWRATDRVRRVNWLYEAEAQSAGTVAPESLLGRALDFWERVYDQTLGNLAGRPGEKGLAESHAERFLRMERALLGLWRHPGVHVFELYRLYQGPLRELISQHCRILAPADWGGPGLIHLPWAWAVPTPAERQMLREMQFGGGMPQVGLRLSGRAWLGIGMLVGLGLVALLAVYTRLY